MMHPSREPPHPWVRFPPMTWPEGTPSEPPHPDAPVIPPGLTLSGVRGQAITPFTIPATTTGSPITRFAASGLPAGLTLDPDTGVISGTPTATVTNRAVTLRATNDEGTGTGVLRVTITPPGVGPPPGVQPTIDQVSSQVILAASPNPGLAAGPHDDGALWMQSNTSELQSWFTPPVTAPPGMFIPVSAGST